MMNLTRPALTGGSHTLPFDKLAPLEFERLCLWLVQRVGYSRAEHLGEAGSEGGRDVVAWKDGRRVVFQCKRVKSFTAAVARAEIQKLRALPPEEQPQELVFVVSQAVSADTRRAARAAWGEEATCHFWAGGELDERVKHHPDLLKEFFQLASPGSSWLYWAAGLSLLAVALALGAWLWPRASEPPPAPSKPEIYAVRVQVLDPEDRPVGGATISTSVGNEPQQLQNGWWEIEIPAEKVPADGKISLWAEHPEWGAKRVDLRLGKHPNLRAEIRLMEPQTWLRGRVIDGNDRALPGVRVSRKDGIPGQAVTDAQGRFALKLSEMPGKRVRVQAEHTGSEPGDTFCYAGTNYCIIAMEAR
jgi:hypothetical protein